MIHYSRQQPGAGLRFLVFCILPPLPPSWPGPFRFPTFSQRDLAFAKVHLVVLVAEGLGCCVCGAHCVQRHIDACCAERLQATLTSVLLLLLSRC